MHVQISSNFACPYDRLRFEVLQLFLPARQKVWAELKRINVTNHFAQDSMYMGDSCQLKGNER